MLGQCELPGVLEGLNRRVGKLISSAFDEPRIGTCRANTKISQLSVEFADSGVKIEKSWVHLHWGLTQQGVATPGVLP